MGTPAGVVRETGSWVRRPEMMMVLMSDMGNYELRITNYELWAAR